MDIDYYSILKSKINNFNILEKYDGNRIIIMSYDIFGIILAHDCKNKSININSIYVELMYQNKGLSYLIFGYALQCCKKHLLNIDDTWILTLDDCSSRYRKSHNLYINIGFKYEEDDYGPEMICNLEHAILKINLIIN